jgi:predicted nucleotide-binding protein (sugar kinase/HSP70/actin superfamily)
MIKSFGFAVLCEDSIGHLGKYRKNHFVLLNQWVYQSRMYAAASYAATAKKPRSDST